MVQMSVGQAVIHTLRAEGVRHVFGIIGSSIQELIDPLYEARDIRFVGTRHEQGAAFMALGHARVTGQTSVCMATNGPGVTNLVTGVYGAYQTHAPVMVITGGPMRAHIHRQSFQELDHVALMRPITKWAAQALQAERVVDLLRHGFRVANAGRKGPVLVDIPRDLQGATDLEVEPLAPEAYRPGPRLRPDSQPLQEAAELLSRARFPILVAGGGAIESGAQQALVALADTLGAPVITSYGHNDAFPNHHALYIGPLGRGGSPEAEEAIRQADVVLALGTRLGHFTTFFDHRFIPQDAGIIQVDIEPTELGRNFPVAVGVLGDALATAEALTQGLRQAGEFPYADQRRRVAAELRARRQQRLEEERHLGTVPLKPQRVYAELRRVLPPETIVALDGGAASHHGYDRLMLTRPRTFLSPLDMGAIGSGFPTAIGAKVARPEAPVLSINGDGGFFMNVQELETAVRHHIGVVAIVMNNNSMGAEKAYQRYLFDERYVEADLTNPRFDKLAELCGGVGFYVERPEEVAPAMEAALAGGRPTVIEIPVDPDELPFPARAADVFKERAEKARQRAPG